MGPGDTPAGNQEAVGIAGDQAPQRDFVSLAQRHSLEDRAAARRVVDVNRVRAAGNGVREGTCGKNVVAGELVQAACPW